MSLRILIGHSQPGQRGKAEALYLGDSGSELEAAKAVAGSHIASFTILNNPPGIRKPNPRFVVESKVKVDDGTKAEPVTKGGKARK